MMMMKTLLTYALPVLHSVSVRAMMFQEVIFCDQLGVET